MHVGYTSCAIFLLQRNIDTVVSTLCTVMELQVSAENGNCPRVPVSVAVLQTGIHSGGNLCTVEGPAIRSVPPLSDLQNIVLCVFGFGEWRPSYMDVCKALTNSSSDPHLVSRPNTARIEDYLWNWRCVTNEMESTGDGEDSIVSACDLLECNRALWIIPTCFASSFAIHRLGCAVQST